ncbi:Ypp1p NDAI_0D02220 [Naumovozyma dairenensis CBS 421]|uniref:Cargo-transport protein YPP1 n=1 Tax=Naumovozyma dairenensis (strain ATCC 10597 / BCRC 20456 / CBS 421 / NBRC 0211 / NRRL Y-12639) TaxID=1071378 RepID=G0W9S5_NAUDC|nr:hypothetical protein NDAI_0D02220 [Naumovozyma dairenensis CBS 421]CCD24536.1 hypothetical protein NDAI_0D02220 [Naumovozyma dairenensis CBS 421]
METKNTGRGRAPIAFALEARMVGANEFYSGIENLDKALHLQFRLHYHTLNKEDALNPSIAKVLLKDCVILYDTLKISISQIVAPEPNEFAQLIVYNLLAILYYHKSQSINENETANENKIKAQKYLLKLSKTLEKRKFSSIYDEFIKLLKLENLYYQGKLLHGSTVKDRHTFYYENILRIFNNNIPTNSMGLIFDYILLIIQDLRINKTIVEPVQILKNLKSESPMACLIAILQLNGKQFDQFYLQIANKFLQNSKFPTANQSNNKNLEQFHLCFQIYLTNLIANGQTIDKHSIDQWENFVISSMGNTFQSIPVAHSAMILFSLIKNKKESILNFMNVVKYTKKQSELNNNQLTDPLSLISSYLFILQNTTKVDNIDTLFDYNNCINELNQMVINFYTTYKFPYVNHINMTNINTSKITSDSKLKLPHIISTKLSKTWQTLYQIQSTDLSKLLSNELSSHLINAMNLQTSTTNKMDLKFNYAYVLSQQNKIDQCIQFLENEILEFYPFHFKAWHLLALCYSTEEDKEKSYRIVNSAIDAMVSTLEDQGQDQDRKKNNADAKKQFTWLEKWQFIQLKMTQITLVEEIFGALDALDMIEELFTSFNELFNDSTVDEIEQKTVKFTLRKEYLLQMIWIFVSNIYIKLDDHKMDALAAIKEATKIKTEFKNLNIDLAEGYYLLNQNKCNDALQKFENVLYYDECNVDAMVGFATMALPESISPEECDIQDYYRLYPSIEYTKPIQANDNDNDDDDKIFVTDVDRSAGIARLKLLLECATLKSIEAYNSPEVWWYLSLVYEKYKDKEYKQALLNCIKLEEGKPIRSFKFCNY